MALTIMASAGSFAAISTLLGSPVLGAFFIMEAAGIGGMTLSLVALPGLLASGLGALVFVGLDNWTGLGTFSLALHVGTAGGATDAGDPGLGPGHGGGRRVAGVVDPLGRTVPSSDRALESGVGDVGTRPADRPHRHGVPAALGSQLHAGVVLRTGGTTGAGRQRRRLFARRRDLADRLQGPRLRALAQRVSWGSGVSLDVSSAQRSALPRAGCPAWTSPRPSAWALAPCAWPCCGCR